MAMKESQMFSWIEFYQKIYDGVTLPDDQMTNGAKDEAKGVTA